MRITSGLSILQDKAFIPVIGPGIAQYAIRVATAGDLGEPRLVLLGRVVADALDIAHHREAERIGVEAAEARIVEPGLEHDARMRMQEFEHRAFGDQPAIVHLVHDLVMHEGRATFVHHLQLLLRIEVLRDIAHDADQLALPIGEPRRPFLDEIEDVFLGQAELAAQRLALGLFVLVEFVVLIRVRNGAPQIVVGLFLIGAAVLGALPFLGEVRLRAMRRSG